MQRLKQHNQGARLSLTVDDFLIARETPRLVGGELRQVRWRVARGGYAEQSVHDFGSPSSGWFWHWHGTVGSERLTEVGSALAGALEAMAGMPASDDPNGVFRRVEFWIGDRAVELIMKDEGGLPMVAVPAFERAWGLVVSVFPGPPSRVYQHTEPRAAPDRSHNAGSGR